MPPRTWRRRKALGQHFLIDTRVARRILDHAGLAPEDTVLEVGPGTGALTKLMAPRVKRLIAAEKDAALAKRLRLEFASAKHVEIVEADAAEDDLTQWGPFEKVVANLPYSVSTPITFQLLPLAWSLAVLMYQKEFALRLVADGPEDAAYGRLSAARAYFATTEYLETVPPGAFQPPPKVASSIVRLRRHPTRPFEVASPDAYLELLRVAFSTRRKTMRSTLRHQHRVLDIPDADTADRVLHAWGHGSERPEEIPPPEFGRLTLLLAEALG